MIMLMIMVSGFVLDWFVWIEVTKKIIYTGFYPRSACAANYVIMTLSIPYIYHQHAYLFIQPRNHHRG